MAFADRHRIDANEQREARGAHTSYGQTPLTQGQNFDPPSRPCGCVRGLRTCLGNNNLRQTGIQRHGLAMQMATVPPAKFLNLVDLVDLLVYLLHAQDCNEG